MDTGVVLGRGDRWGINSCFCWLGLWQTRVSAGLGWTGVVADELRKKKGRLATEVDGSESRTVDRGTRRLGRLVR